MIYLVQATDTDIYKIGNTSNLDRRLYSLRGSSPVPLLLASSWDIPSVFEYLLHEKFSESRLHGEWFRPDDLTVIKLTGCETIDDLIGEFELDKLKGYLPVHDLGNIPL